MAIEQARLMSSLQEAQVPPRPMEPGAAGPTKRVLLVRGGVLTRFSGIGGAFHDLKNALEDGEIPGWQSAGVEEYDLGENPSGLKRLRERWFRHPARVAAHIKRLHHANEVDLVFVSDELSAHGRTCGRLLSPLVAHLKMVAGSVVQA